jgi:branched-chain amino acid transport system permease protein
MATKPSEEARTSDVHALTVDAPTAVAPVSRPIGGVVRQPVWIGLLACAGVALVALPWLTSAYWIRVFTMVFMLAALAQSLNVIAGFTGYADFGNGVYFGIGAYATGFLMQQTVPAPAAVLLGALLAMVIAALLGLPILRLKGHYFAIATIGIMEGTRELVTNMGFLGGGQGLNIPIIRMSPAQFSMVMYFLMFGLMVGYTLLVWTISRSSLGYGLRAIKGDEQAAAVMGIDTTRYKVAAWCTSAACTAIVGGVYAIWSGFIEPPVAFDIVRGTEYFMMMLLGGAGTVFGPILGAFVLHLIGNFVWSQFAHGHLAVLGIVIVLIVLFLPGGLMNAFRNGLAWRGRSRTAADRRPTANAA